MGVVLSLIRVSPETLTILNGNPRAVADFVYGDPKLAPGVGFLSRLFGKKEEVVAVPKRSAGDEIDLDKLWDILNFLLTGGNKNDDHPLSFLGRKWPPLCNLPDLLGPPMAIDAGAVNRFSDALKAVSDEDLLATFNSEAMVKSRVYFKEFLENDATEVKAELLVWIQELRPFIGHAASANEAMIMYYS